MIQLQNINLNPPEDIQQLANTHAIAVNLRDTFPYPYKIEDATTFLMLSSLVAAEIPPAIIMPIAQAAAFVQTFRYIVSSSSHLK